MPFSYTVTYNHLRAHQTAGASHTRIAGGHEGQKSPEEDQQETTESFAYVTMYLPYGAVPLCPPARISKHQRLPVRILYLRHTRAAAKGCL